jgi:ankyrin repeat protein
MEMVALLLANGASPNVKDKAGRTALDWATKNDHISIVDLLSRQGGIG